MDPRAQAVHEFWFADVLTDPGKIAERSALWFPSAKDAPVVDAAIRSQFGSLVDSASNGELDAWRLEPKSLLALLLLLDQFRRSLFRGSAHAFALDRKAEALCLSGLEQSFHRALEPIERVFFLMPLEHSESPATQERSIREFEKLADEVPPNLSSLFANFASYAREHRDIVVRFGRFPHRNRILGRDSTEAERLYLSSGAPDFGQR